MKEKTIDGVRVLTEPLAVMPALFMFADIGHVIVPVLQSLKGMESTLTGFASVKDMDLEKAVPMLVHLFRVLDGEAATRVVRQVLMGGGTSVVMKVDGKPQLRVLDSDETLHAGFGGKLATMLKAVAFVFEVNFKNHFSGGLGSQESDLPKVSPSDLTTSTTPTL